MPKKKKKPESVSIFSKWYGKFVSRMYIWIMLLVAIPVFIIVLVLFWLFSGSNSNENRNLAQQILPSVQQNILLPTPTLTVPAPYMKDNPSSPSAFTARSAIALDMDSKQVLFSKDEKLQLWPASTTKLMTAIIAVEQYSPDEVVNITSPVATGSRMGLVEGEKITVENLLYGLLIQSANDAAYALARHDPNGQGDFVGRMNQKAEELGLENTHFFDPAGFDNDKQYTTASDLSKLALHALEHKMIAKIVSIPLITVPDDDFIHFHQLRNVNQLLGTVPGVAGVKTGWTENAKENLVNLTKRNNHEVLTVILGSDDRFGETKALTDWVFDNYEWPVSSSQ